MFVEQEETRILNPVLLKLARGVPSKGRFDFSGRGPTSAFSNPQEKLLLASSCNKPRIFYSSQGSNDPRPNQKEGPADLKKEARLPLEGKMRGGAFGINCRVISGGRKRQSPLKSFG